MIPTLIDKGFIVESLWHSVDNAAGSLDNVPGLVRRVIQTEAWRCRIHEGKTYEHPSFVSFITGEPLGGCGWSLEKVEALLHDDLEVLAMWQEMIKGQHGGDRKSKYAEIKTDNVQLDNPGGNSRKVTLERLKRKTPALFERVVTGELSANAAAIEAGFRRAPPTPFEQVQKLLPKLSADQIQELLKEIERLKIGV